MGKLRNFLHGRGFVNASSSVIAMIVGLFFGYLILLISNPSQSAEGIGIILQGGFSGGAKGVGNVLYFATPIIMTGLSLGFAFKTGLFNIGATGQFTVGTFAALYIGVHWTFLPASVHWMVALLGAFAAGALWSLIPGLLKAYLNVNEVISTIMFNYLGMYSVNLLTKEFIYDSAKNLSMDVAPSAEIPKMGLDHLFYKQIGNFTDQSTVNGGFFIAVGVAILVYILLNKTTFGYELKACGYNRFASRYAGINERRNIVLSLVVAGALSGLGGGLLYLSGPTGRHYQVLDVLLGEGFDGIAVALLGLSNPIGIIFAALFVSYITLGGNFLQALNYVPEVIEIIIAIIIYFAAFSLVFKNLVMHLVKGKDVMSAAREAAAEGIGVERPPEPPEETKEASDAEEQGKGEA